MSRNVVQTKLICKDEATKVFNDLGKSIRNNTMLGNLMATGLTSAMGSAVDGAKQFIGLLGKAAEMQNTMTISAGTFANITGKDFGEASAMVQGLSVDISKLAAALPGSNETYTKYMMATAGSISAAFTDANGVLDETNFKMYALENSKIMGIRGNQEGLFAHQVISGVQAAIEGESMASLSKREYFQKNSDIILGIKKDLLAEDRTWESLTNQQRLMMLTKNSQLNQEAIDQLTNSAKGTLENVAAKLFDQNIGFFGFLKDLDTDLEGNQSAFAEIEKVVRTLFGAGGTFPLIGSILNKLGFLDENSAMDGVRDGAIRLDNWLKKVNSALTLIQGKVGNENFSFDFDFGEMTQGLGDKLGKKINESLKSTFDIGQLDMSTNLGGFMADVINGLTNGVSEIDWTMVGLNFFKFVGGALYACGVALSKLDWGDLAKTLLIAVAGATAAAVLVLIGTIGVTFAGLTAPLWALAAGITAGIVGLVVGAQNLWKEKGEDIKKGLLNFTQNIVNLFNGMNKAAVDLLNKIPFVSIGEEDKKKSKRRRFRNHAAGLDQGGIFDAMDRETSAMPLGAGLVLANDSELIMNRSQQGQLSNLLNSRQTPSLTVGSLTIHAGNTTDPEKLATEVMRKIEAKWNKFTGNQLSPAY